MNSNLKLIVLGDSCSGVPGHAHESNLSQIVAAVRRKAATADALCFLGDHISGYVPEERELRAQWNWFLNKEFLPLKTLAPRIFHMPGNHDCYDQISRRMFQQVLPVEDHPELILREGLNYAVRIGESALIFLNTANPDDYGRAKIDLVWLEHALAQTAETAQRLVFGHHPILPVNGYDEPYTWCVHPDEGALAWSMMCRHRVSAYLCSHIIAFDFQVRDDMVQLCSGGAGTEYGPLGAMPGPEEYRHFVLVDAQTNRFSFEVFDAEGVNREGFSWSPNRGHPLETLTLSPHQPVTSSILEHRGASSLRLCVHSLDDNAAGAPFMVCGSASHGSEATVTIARDGETGEASVVMSAPDGRSLRWVGPRLSQTRPHALEIDICGGIGPGGVLSRMGDGGWSSLTANTAQGPDAIHWPSIWTTLSGSGHVVSLGVFA